MKWIECYILIKNWGRDSVRESDRVWDGDRGSKRDSGRDKYHLAELR